MSPRDWRRHLVYTWYLGVVENHNSHINIPITVRAKLLLTQPIINELQDINPETGNYVLMPGETLCRCPGAGLLADANICARVNNKRLVLLNYLLTSSIALCQYQQLEETRC